MLRKVTVNGRTLDVQLGPEGAYTIDGREGTASVVELEPGVFSIIVEGRCYEARVRNGTVYVNGDRYNVEVQDPRSVSLRNGAAAAGRHTVKAAMPGKVVRILVSEGEAIRAGQGIVVVEAMKMQNELRSPVDGVVTSLSVKEGAPVRAGDALAVVEAS
ncbi:MAG TPA: biotin/lipoyl-containing protein [Bryobacteraceae bacterium]|nr:biotin/lipoyl-containing protein [Bryobacteraceae bacterium]